MPPPPPCLLDPIENTGVEVGEVYAYRAWLCLDRALILKSPLQDCHWTPGLPMVGTPAVGSLAGINAFKTLENTVAEFEAFTNFAKASRCLVIGKVALWGEIIEYDDGYRAEYGIPVSLDMVFPPTVEALKHLAKLKAVYELPAYEAERAANPAPVPPQTPVEDDGPTYEAVFGRPPPALDPFIILARFATGLAIVTMCALLLANVIAWMAP